MLGWGSWVSSRLDEVNVCSLAGLIGGGSSVVEERQGECSNHCCCHCILDYAVVVDEFVIVLGTQVDETVNIRIVVLRFVHLDMDVWAGRPSALETLVCS